MPRIEWDNVQSGYELPVRVVEGSRNDEMHRYLSSIRGKGASDEQVEAAALEANAAHFEPPIGETELRTIIRSVCTYEVGDGSYHGEPEPTAILPTNIPIIDRHVDVGVLPDLSGMSPNEQAKAYVRACFDGMDESQMPWTDTICLTRNLAAPWDDGYEYAGTLLGMAGYEALDKYLPSVEDAGMWCCVNPLLPDRYRRDKTSVAAYRNLLVECDTLPMADQLQRMLDIFWDKGGHRDGLLRAIVDSGNKSYHCVIRVDSRSRQDYAIDAQFVYDLCERNGLPVDRKCANPTRLTRFPGAMRANKGRMQRLVWAYGI